MIEMEKFSKILIGKGQKEASEQSFVSVAEKENGIVKPGIDSQLWHACAGGMVQLPQIGGKVIYFPQGHGEHAANAPEFPPSLRLKSTIACRVLSVAYLADLETDEVYAQIRLQPESGKGAADCSNDSPPPPPPCKTVSFAKTLTQSDANNGGGFSVPRYCAETIFPRLDYSIDPPVQTVLAKDVHGTVWKFRHIYRGTPRRHLLTTGWSNFVNQKKLVAGDAIIFLRSASGELCVGVRRSARSTIIGYCDPSPWHVAAVHQNSRQEGNDRETSFKISGGEDGIGDTASLNLFMGSRSSLPNNPSNFSRNRAHVTAKSVLEAATLAVAGKPFDVLYYPRASISEFCVNAHTVGTALQQTWESGMRFKIAFETEDSSRISWFMGTIAKVQVADPICWPTSPWKMLQVTWDEPDLLQGVTRVSPWQVESVSPMHLPPFSLPKKKLRVSQSPELQLDTCGIMGLTMAALANNYLRNLNPWHGFIDCVPAGMQGARQGQLYGVNLEEYQQRSQPGASLENYYQPQGHLGAGGLHVPTELNVGSFVQNERSSTQSNSSSTLLMVGNSQNQPTDANVESWEGNVNSKSKSFLLFGKFIDASQSAKAQSQLSEGVSTGDLVHDSVSDGNQSEVIDKMQWSLRGTANECRTSNLSSGFWLHQGSTLESPSKAVESLDQPSKQPFTNKEKRVVDVSFIHCKVFKECEEVGRTVDLALFNSYVELYQKLSKMFGIEETQIFNRVLYTDCEGFSRFIGDEPYRDFIKKARRIRIMLDLSIEK